MLWAAFGFALAAAAAPFGNAGGGAFGIMSAGGGGAAGFVQKTAAVTLDLLRLLPLGGVGGSPVGCRSTALPAAG